MNNFGKGPRRCLYLLYTVYDIQYQNEFQSFIILYTVYNKGTIPKRIENGIKTKANQTYSLLCLIDD